MHPLNQGGEPRTYGVGGLQASSRIAFGSTSPADYENTSRIEILATWYKTPTGGGEFQKSAVVPTTSHEEVEVSSASWISSSSS